MITPERARSVRLVAMDVDGVLTEGGIFLGSTGGEELEFKRYDIQDGMGLHLLKMAGIRTAILTGRESESVRMRARELGIDDCLQDRKARKLPAFRELCRRRGISPEEAAFIGDDLPDLGVLRIVGLPVAVGNAAAEVKAMCAVQLTRNGGHGAVREFVELLLKARGEWDDLVEQYVLDRSGEPAPPAPPAPAGRG
jgi:3-deoxy-D-manno-octulosonate 8-phosphate phosphatase (KDO 8-P phosphatase)